ncbi:hypothetical protein C8J57DRAFT_1514736 [Mycena rebaudengoi]|nr:hypothetical protein C8J57DRAFT_1514736 [Mycena rebaudengoi]
MRVSRDSRSRRPLLEAQAPAHGRGLLGALVAGTPKPALFLETQVSFSARRPCDFDAARTPGGYATSPQMWTSRPPAVSACPVGKCGIYPRAFITTREATASLWACPLLDACLWVVIAKRRVDSLLSPTRLTCAEVGKRAGREAGGQARHVTRARRPLLDADCQVGLWVVVPGGFASESHPTYCRSSPIWMYPTYIPIAHYSPVPSMIQSLTV